MDDRKEKEMVQRVFSSSLSGLKENPYLTQRVLNIVHKEREVIIRKKVSFSLSFAIVLALLSCTALAVTLLYPNVFSMFFTELPANADDFIQRDLARESFAHCDVEVREAAYDGMTLYVLYSIRDRNATERLSATNLPEHMTSIPTFPAMQEDHVGWWWDNIWIDGKAVNMSNGTIDTQRIGTQPGELLFYQMYRLDRDNVYLNGTVEIALPIGERQPYDTLVRGADGRVQVPEKGVITFTLDAEHRGDYSVTTPSDFPPVVTSQVTASVSQVIYSPLQTYITLSLQSNEEAFATFLQENRDEQGNLRYNYTPVDMIEPWVLSLSLVDDQGTIQFVHDSPEIIWSEDVEFVYPFVDSQPEKLFLAPIVEGKAVMAEAIRVR